VLAYIWWRFGGPDTLSFIILSGGFTAIMDFISSFVVRNYEYPGQAHLCDYPPKFSTGLARFFDNEKRLANEYGRIKSQIKV